MSCMKHEVSMWSISAHRPNKRTIWLLWSMRIMDVSVESRCLLSLRTETHSSKSHKISHRKLSLWGNRCRSIAYLRSWKETHTSRLCSSQDRGHRQMRSSRWPMTSGADTKAMVQSHPWRPSLSATSQQINWCRLYSLGAISDHLCSSSIIVFL